METWSELSRWLVLLWACHVFTAALLLYKTWLGRRPKDMPDEAQHDQIVDDATLPLLCVQLPVFNEPDHVDGLLETVAGLNWPRDRFEIQVLDDSTDNTPVKVAAKLAELRDRQPELQIIHLQRPHREGYKAGALEYGMGETEAEFLAVFDADFRPRPDFLLAMMPEFMADPKAAAVQARWSFYNEEQNILTRLQTLLLNVHFRLEHWGRARRGWTFNFNGTAGIWRRAGIEAGGGWPFETVTEDLLLSYRAQLKGWHLQYRDDVDCPSELPPQFGAFLVQQRRWARGNGQVLRGLGASILRYEGWSWRRRLDSMFHLGGYGWTGILGALFFLAPLWVAAEGALAASHAFYHPWRLVGFASWLLLVVALGVLFGQVLVAGQRRWWRRYGIVLALFCLAPLVILLVTPSFWRGLLAGGSSPALRYFARTPKGRLAQRPRRWDRNLVGLVALIDLVCVGLALQHGFPMMAILLAIKSWLTVTIGFDQRILFYRRLLADRV